MAGRWWGQRRDAVTIAYVGLGSNIGNRPRHLDEALLALNQHEHIDVVRVSDYIETIPVGGPPQPDYLNAVAQIDTDLGPEELLAAIQQIEQDMGRKRIEKWGPRLIDIDIELYGDRIVDLPHLKIPHPLMHERRFVLQPLCQIAPDARHPKLGLSAKQMLSALLQK
jgi:2-amino-4-hydroxy-6-hydroxymethyldihydropteridine diphosphokinase